MYTTFGYRHNNSAQGTLFLVTMVTKRRNWSRSWFVEDANDRLLTHAVLFLLNVTQCLWSETN